MAKRRPNPDQTSFVFDTPPTAMTAASLAGDAVRVSNMVADILHEDPRSREEIAGLMSRLLGESVTKAMLDNYAAPSAGHTISYSRLKALVAVTSRHDLLDGDLRSIGASLLVGEEIKLARAGHLMAHRRRIDAELRELDRTIRPIARGTL